jgi:hypothetical protein
MWRHRASAPADPSTHHHGASHFFLFSSHGALLVTDRRFVSYADAVRGGSFTPNQHFKMSGDDVLGHLTYRSTSSRNKSKQQ